MANPFFNAEYYLAQNEDLAAAFGDDHAAAEAHYFNFGAIEALNGAPSRKPVAWFDIEYYLSSNPDLEVLEPQDLFAHFVLNGIREGRSPMEGVELDVNAYAAANEDLRTAFGIEDADDLTPEQELALANHFYERGYLEDREGAPEIPDTVDPVDRTELAEALKNLSDAGDAVDEFEEENGDVEQQLADAEEALAIDRENGTEAQLAAAVVVAEANLAAAEEAYEAGASEELIEAVATYEAEMDKLRALKEVRDAAKAVAEAQVETFQAAHPEEEFEAIFSTETGEDEDPIELEDLGLWRIIRDDETGEEIDREHLVEFDTMTGRVVATEDGADYAGINQLIAVVNDWLIDSDAVNDQQEVRDGAEAAAKALEGGDLFNDVLVAERELKEAIEAVDARQELIDNVDAAQALVDQLELLLADEEAAWDALEALGYESIEPAVGDVTASGDGDIFVFVEEDASITGFGQEADDVLYFDASEFTYNAGEIGDGDNNVREFFLVQDGDNVNILFEQNDYGSAADQFDTIVLVGTDIASVQVDDLGFISL